jgi:hypothetical protein
VREVARRIVERVRKALGKGEGQTDPPGEELPAT